MMPNMANIMANIVIQNPGPVPLRTMYIKRVAAHENDRLLKHNLHHTYRPTTHASRYHGFRLKNTPPACCKGELNKPRQLQHGIDSAQTQTWPQCKSPDSLDGELDSLFLAAAEQILSCVTAGDAYRCPIGYCGLPQHDNQITKKTRHWQRKGSGQRH